MSDATRNHDHDHDHCMTCKTSGGEACERAPAAPSPSPRETHEPATCGECSFFVALGNTGIAGECRPTTGHHQGDVVGTVYAHEEACNDPGPASPRSPSATPDPAAWEVYVALRSRYASACERMGMAHANGTRAEWEDAAHSEVERRLALNAAVRSLSRATPDRAKVERALDDFGACCKADGRLDFNSPHPLTSKARAALLDLVFPEKKP